MQESRIISKILFECFSDLDISFREMHNMYNARHKSIILHMQKKANKLYDFNELNEIIPDATKAFIDDDIQFLIEKKLLSYDFNLCKIKLTNKGKQWREESEPFMYEDKLIAFIDILGFKCLIESDSNFLELNKIGYTLEQVKELNTEFIKHINQIIEAYAWEDKYKFNFSMFSDSIVCSVRYNEKIVDNFLKLIADSVRIYIRNDMSVRGGICRGQLMHEGDILFGPAMLQAYKMESEEAIYPRILIENSVVQDYKEIDNIIMKDSASEENWLNWQYSLDVAEKKNLKITFEEKLKEAQAQKSCKKRERKAKKTIVEKLQWMIDSLN